MSDDWKAEINRKYGPTSISSATAPIYPDHCTYVADDHPQAPLNPPPRPIRYSDGRSVIIAAFVFLGAWAAFALGLIYFG